MKFRKWLVAAVIGGSVLSAAAYAGLATAPGHDHGRVVALLPILSGPDPAFPEHQIIYVKVHPGQLFSIKVHTSDGPFFWDESGRPPDPRLIKTAGDFNDGHFPAGLVGCRVPYFHTLLARRAGATSMTWRFHNVSCPAGGNAAARCRRITTVVFDITIR